MTRKLSSALAMRPCVLAATLLFLVNATFVPAAHAGLGDLLKKAKDKATQITGKKAGEKTPGADGNSDAVGGKVEFTDVILELTSDRLDQFLAGMKAGGSNAAERSALVAEKEKLDREQDALIAKNGSAIDESRSKRIKAEDCWDSELREARSTRSEEMRQKLAADPAAREKMMHIAQRMSQAQAKGDTAGMNQARREMEAMGAPTHADSVATGQKCGPIPPLHPAAAQVDKLRGQTSQIEERIRDMDKKLESARSKASGMDAAQFAMVQERVQMYLDARKADSKPRNFTKDELAALASHYDALKAALE
jgi:hypothetical protein